MLIEKLLKMHPKAFGALLFGTVILSGCAETEFLIHSAKRIATPTTSIPQQVYKVGTPYQINGITYYPEEDFSYEETGIASWYGAKFHGRKTANGETYDMNALTAAHRTLPMPSYVRVTNLENGRSLVLLVNDRGPYARNRIIDVSRKGAQLLGYDKKGTARVRVQILADKSRALKARLAGQRQLARTGSPITVDRLPKPPVTSQTLPPVGSKQVILTPPLEPVRMANSREIATDVTPNDGQVSQVSVGKTGIYIQAGAFSKFENANKVKASLTGIGPTNLTQTLINGVDFYRVRIGPFNNIDEADHMLESVALAGYPSARIVVD